MIYLSKDSTRKSGLVNHLFLATSLYFWPHSVGYGILVPNWNLHLLHWKHGVLTVGPLGRSEIPAS